MEKIRDIINSFVAAIGKAASWLTAGLVLLVCADVFYRRVLNDSQAWVGELEWHFFALIFLLGSAYALQKDRHVRVDLFYANFSDRDKAWVNLLGSILFLIPWCLLIIYLSSGFVLESFVDMEGSPNPNGLPYRWIVKAGMVFGFVLLILQAISQIISSVLILKNKEKELNL